MNKIIGSLIFLLSCFVQQSYSMEELKGNSEQWAERHLSTLEELRQQQQNQVYATMSRLCQADTIREADDEESDKQSRLQQTVIINYGNLFPSRKIPSYRMDRAEYPARSNRAKTLNEFLETKKIELFTAIDQENIQAIRRLIGDPIINARDEKGRNLLARACSGNKIESLKELLKQGVYYQCFDEYAENTYEVIETLLKNNPIAHFILFGNFNLTDALSNLKNLIAQNLNTENLNEALDYAIVHRVYKAREALVNLLLEAGAQPTQAMVERLKRILDSRGFMNPDRNSYNNVINLLATRISFPASHTSAISSLTDTILNRQSLRSEINVGFVHLPEALQQRLLQVMMNEPVRVEMPPKSDF